MRSSRATICSRSSLIEVAARADRLIKNLGLTIAYNAARRARVRDAPDRCAVQVRIVAPGRRQRAPAPLAAAKSVLVYLIPIALLLGLTGLCVFLWALRSGQFDDLDGAAERILLDDEDG